LRPQTAKAPECRGTKFGEIDPAGLENCWPVGVGKAGGDEHVAPVALRGGEVSAEAGEIAGGKLQDCEVDAFAVVVDQRKIGGGEFKVSSADYMLGQL